MNSYFTWTFLILDLLKLSNMDLGDQSQQLPVFVQPNEINFVLGKTDTYKSLLTIFNPYPFNIRFRVLCNEPSKYAIGLTKGLIRHGCYLDTTIRHKNPTVVESDCLRLEIYRLDDGEHPCGQKEIYLNVVKGNFNRPNTQRLMEFSETEILPNYSDNRSRAILGLSRNIDNQGSTQSNSHNFYWLALISFLFCISVLFLPQFVEQESSKQYSWIPTWLRPSSTSKIVSAYVLGILTVYFFLQPAA